MFYHDEAQKAEALAIIDEIVNEEIWPNPVVTKVTEINNYYEAETYHQDYFKNNPQTNTAQWWLHLSSPSLKRRLQAVYVKTNCPIPSVVLQAALPFR